MISYVVVFSIFILTTATTNSHTRTICDIHDQINKTLHDKSGLSPMLENDLQLMVCLAALHSSLPNSDSLMGLFGLDRSFTDICRSIALSFEDNDLSDEVSCYLRIREKSSSNLRVAPEDFCKDITEKSTSFPIKYERVTCADHIVIVPSKNSKRLYRILSGQEANHTKYFEYSRFRTNTAYYDRNLYVNFFLDRSRRFWGKLNKTFNDLTHRPIRLAVMLLVVCFILILALRYLSTNLENAYLNLDQKSKGSRIQRSISCTSR